MTGDRLVVGGLLVVLISNPWRAQETDATLSGTVTNARGAIVPNAKVSVKNVAIVNPGKPGDDEVSFTADGSAA